MRAEGYLGRGVRGAEPLGLLTSLAIAAFAVAALYFARELFVPLALAIMLSFVLTPPVLKLRAWGLARSVSVLLVVALAFLIIVAIGTVVARQLTELAQMLPRYELTLREKLRALRPEPGSSGVIERATEAVEKLGKELGSGEPPQSGAPAGAGAAAGAAPQPVPVEIHQPPPRPLDYVREFFITLLHPLATAGLVLVFTVFILLQREDLRDRVIRVTGGHDLERTTAAISDAAYRLSRLFLTYTIMNAAYGTFIAAALWLIGVPTPVLWGLLAGLMRFVPYIGSIIAGGFPILLAAAVYPGWGTAAMTLGLFLVSESLMGQVMEPWLLGRATGLSPLATILSVSFWTWLWGPIGLLLAIPLTVCVIVLGRHVERMHFMYVLLGDEPALSPEQAFYQRLLANDGAELVYQAEQQLEETSLLDYLDTVALPALRLAQEDARRGRFSRERLAEMAGTVHELIEELSELEPEAAERAEAAEADGEPAPPDLPVLAADDLDEAWRGTPVLCLGVRSPLDEAAAAMLALLAGRHGIGCEVASPEQAGTSGLPRLDLARTQVAVLSYLDSDAPAYARYLARRLRRRKADLVIVLGFWGGRTGVADIEADLQCRVASASTFRAALAALVAAAGKASGGERAEIDATPARKPAATAMAP